MQIDFAQLDSNREFRTDVCIVGAGAAGIALAHELATHQVNSILVESGGLIRNEQIDILSEGETVGLKFTGLTEGRARAFGGATLLWFGQCIRLDPIDYEVRDWVPYSGWPLDESTLAPFYDRAEAFLGLSHAVYDERIWQSFGLTDPGFSSDRLLPRFTIYCATPNFARAYGRQLRAAPKLDILLNATATRLSLDASQSRVESIELQHIAGRKGKLFAKHFVLCTGGIENARLLLLSSPQGVGNRRGLVGRFLQDHPNMRTGRLIPNKTRRLQEQFGMLHRAGLKYWPKLALSPEQQRRLGVLNAIAHPVYDYSPHSPASRLKRLLGHLRERRIGTSTIRDLGGLLPAVPMLAGMAGRLLIKGQAPAFEPSAIALQGYTEQPPNPDSRICLSQERDALGLPSARVDWKSSDLERRTLLALSRAIDSEFSRLGFGKLDIEPVLEQDSPAFTAKLSDAFHHAGTTRMSRSETDGVVDVDCRVHGVSNLYLCGGSVFPTSGYANPTLTIIALAFWVADKLVEKLRRDENQFPCG